MEKVPALAEGIDRAFWGIFSFQFGFETLNAILKGTRKGMFV